MKRFRAVLAIFSALLCLFVIFSTAKVRGEEAVELPIVMYHHLSRQQNRCNAYVLPVSQFEKDIQYLSEQGYQSVTVSDLLAWQEGESLPEKPVMITFDDGFESTLAYAAPILEKYGMRGVVSIIGSVVQTYTDAPDHNLAYSYLNWEEVEKIAQSGPFEVQCHTWDLHGLSGRTGCNQRKGEDEASYKAMLRRDLMKFQETYAVHTGQKTTALALPYGAGNENTRSVAKELGFRAVFTCEERVNRLTGKEDELLRLGRFNRPTGESSAAFFGKKFQGAV